MMRQRTAIVTGASAGMGKVAAIDLVGKGWRVIGTGRDPERSAAADAEICAAAKDGGSFEMLKADLSLLAQARRLAGEIAARTDRIDLLLNNAGAMAKERALTEEGLEENFAGNHHGPFLLTNLLVPLLRKAAEGAPAGGVRIVNTASNASEMTDGLPFGDLARLDGVSAGQLYCKSKLANVLHAQGLAKRLAADGIVVHSYNPGPVASYFFARTGRDSPEYMAQIGAVSVEEGADTMLWLATAEEPGRSTGGYWEKRAPRAPNPFADDPANAETLWAESEAITAAA